MKSRAERHRDRHLPIERATPLITAVAQFYGVNRDELLSDSRRQPLAEIRQVAMSLLQSELQFSYALAARALGRSDHVTAMHASKVVARKATALQLHECLIWVRKTITPFEELNPNAIHV